MTVSFDAVRRHAMAVAVLIGVVGCSSGSDGAAPTSVGSSDLPGQLYISAVPMTPGCPAPGDVIPSGPSVIVTAAGGKPWANIAVHFSVVAGGGTIASSTALSNAAGVATAGPWRLGGVAGVNSVIVSLESGASVGISVSTVLAKVVVVYRLLAIGGRPLPQTYTAGTITGGHYYLADNGTFEFAYEYAPVDVPATICSDERYVTDAEATVFYDRNGQVLSTGVLSGSTVTVTYQDTVDFDTETYEVVAVGGDAGRANKRQQ